MNEKEFKSITCKKTGNCVTLDYENCPRSGDQTISVVGKKVIDFGCSEERTCPFVSINNGETIDLKKCLYYPDNKA